MINNIKENQITQEGTKKVSNYYEYVHNLDSDHRVTRAVSAQEALDDVRQHLDYEQDDFIQKFSHALSDSKNISEYIDYVSTEQYFKSHNKTMNSFRFEETYFNQQLENMADIILNEYDNQNGEYSDYTLMSDYAIEQNQYREVAIETDYDSEGIERGLAVHVDVLDGMSQGQNLELSERAKRNTRYADVRANLDKYPDLKQMYEAWEEMGYNYGFHQSYTKEEKEAIREKWLAKFAEEKDHQYSPQNRMRLIQKHYNELGYDMSLALKGLRNITYTKPSNHHSDVTYDDNEKHQDMLIDVLKLDEIEHVLMLLEIEREGRKGRVVGLDGVHHLVDWYPILSMLEERHGVERDAGGISGMLYEFYLSIKYADLEDYQREIFNLIRQNEKYLHRELNECWVSELLDNPYEMMIDYIEYKYDIELTMRQLRAEIRKIAKVAVDTFNDLLDDAVAKECRGCSVEKMPSAYSGRRAVCKKCMAKRQREASLDKVAN